MNEGFDWTAFGTGFVTALILVLLLRWRRRSARLTDLRARPPAPPMPVALAPDVKAQALLMKVEGRSIEAIKLVRRRTGCDLKQAKDTVDALR